MRASARHAIRLLPCAFVALGMAASSGPARAFDTGHHVDLTRIAMQELGFNATAIGVAQMENWLVDFYSSADLTGQIKPFVERMHFDKLLTEAEVTNYWGRLTVNTRIAVRASVLAKDRLRLLTVIGMSFHAVQDFYTHSNWVETHPRADNAPFRTETWFNSNSAGLGIRTGNYPNNDPIAPATDHGDYFQGMNHDSYVRPRWQDAYVFAYAASKEWLNACKRWAAEVDPDFWTLARNITLTPAQQTDLSVDLTAAYRISEWITDLGLGGADGHWKGNGSGSAADFVPFFATWTTAADSIFVQQFRVKQWYLDLSGNLTGATPPATPVPAVPKIITNDRRAVIISTVSFTDLSTGVFDSKFDPPFGTPDFYAQISLGGETFLEAMQVDKGDFLPYWTTIKFVPTTTQGIDIRYELWDEDGIGFSDDQADINPAAGVRGLNFRFTIASHQLSGDLSGLHDTLGSAVASAGAEPDTLRARIRLWVTERKLQ